MITWYCYSLFYHSWLHDTVIPYFTICNYMILLFSILPFVITWYCYSLFYHLWLHDTVIPYFTICDYMILLFSVLPFVITWYCYSLFYHLWLHDTVILCFTIRDYMILQYIEISTISDCNKTTINSPQFRHESNVKYPKPPLISLFMGTYIFVYGGKLWHLLRPLHQHSLRKKTNTMYFI